AGRPARRGGPRRGARGALKDPAPPPQGRDKRRGPLPLLRLYPGGFDDFRPPLQFALDKRIKLLRRTPNDVRSLSFRNRLLHCWELQDLVEDAIDPSDQTSVHASRANDAMPTVHVKSGYRLRHWRRIRQLRHWPNGNACKRTDFTLSDLAQ